MAVLQIDDMWDQQGRVGLYFFVGTFFHSRTLQRLFRPFQLNDRVAALAEPYMDVAPRALGLHVRTWTQNMVSSSRGRWHICGASLRFHPLQPFYECAVGDFDIVYTIEQHRTDPE